MLKAIRAIYDDGKIEFLEKEPSGKYATVIVFLETLSKDEIEDMILAKQLGLEKDYENAIGDLHKGRITKAKDLREKLRGKIG